MVTVPDVDCPGHVRAETISNIVKNIKLRVFGRGMICVSFEEELDVVIRPSANTLTTGAT
jgi:glycerol-3-phosphate responsive antiterminator